MTSIRSLKYRVLCMPQFLHSYCWHKIIFLAELLRGTQGWWDKSEILAAQRAALKAVPPILQIVWPELVIQMPNKYLQCGTETRRYGVTSCTSLSPDILDDFKADLLVTPQNQIRCLSGPEAASKQQPPMHTLWERPLFLQPQLLF